MIEKLVDSTKYKDKKGTLSIIGNLLFDYEYEASFVAGVLANIYHEGNIGKFESSAYSPDKKPKYLEYMDTLYNYKIYIQINSLLKFLCIIYLIF